MAVARIAVIRTILKRCLEDFGISGVDFFEFGLEKCMLDWMVEKSNANSLVMDCLYRYLLTFRAMKDVSLSACLKSRRGDPMVLHKTILQSGML